MERGVNYIFIGACFVLSLVGFVVFIFWFSDSGIFRDEVRIFKSYTKRPLNIKVDSQIKYKGLNVGRVANIAFRDNNFEEIEITLEIRKDLPVRQNSTIRVEQSGILGQSFIALVQNEQTSALIEDSRDAVLMISNDSMSQILEAIPNITNKVDFLMDNANEILNAQNAQNLAQTLESLNNSMKNIATLSQNLALKTSQIDQIIANLTNITAQLNGKLKSGEYDLKTTLAPTLMAIEGAMGEFENFAKNANGFLQKLESNPYNTIFGYRED